MEDNKNNNEGFIPKHGGYQNLITYQKSEIIYDATVYFTKRFFRKYDRTIARASLEELMIDYKDFLRTGKLPIWDKNHRLVLRFREINKTPNATYETYKKAIEHEQPEICANAMVCLINIVSYLLSRQIKTLEQAFLKEGGLRERMTKARIESRKKNEK